MLECMNGEHRDHVSTLGALKFIFERHISNLDNWSITTKVFIILHRGLQNIKVNRKIIKDLKAKEHLMHPYQKKGADQKYDIKMFMEISKHYASYIKFYLNVSIKTDILCKSLAGISNDVAQLSTP
jgi:hypothetical protein